MNRTEIKQISIEIHEAMRGRRFGKIFPLSATSFALDLHPHAGCYLFVDLSQKNASAFLIIRKLKELERAAAHSSPFIIYLRKTLTGRELISVFGDAGSIRLEFSATDNDVLALIIQLRAGPPNAFVVDGNGVILDAARSSDRAGQKVGDVYVGLAADDDTHAEMIASQDDGLLSAVFDAERRQYETEASFALLAKEARKKIRNDLTKRQKLLANLDGDLAQHGNADQWKKFGDLILASISTLRRESDSIYVTDYFDSETPEIAIAADKNESPVDVAERYFRKYTKARNAFTAITDRKNTVSAEIEQLTRRQEAVESAIALQDEEALSQFVSLKRVEPHISKEKKRADEFTGARRFIASAGYEILVGKKAKDNDHLTFRIAKANDTWLHAADYPGSHVIIRNPNRKEIPVQTLLEAAQLAAFYSDAREKPKAAVNYTLKKFVNKPKRAAPGLASLSSFKTILVEPGFPDTVEKAEV